MYSSKDNNLFLIFILSKRFVIHIYIRIRENYTITKIVILSRTVNLSSALPLPSRIVLFFIIILC